LYLLCHYISQFLHYLLPPVAIRVKALDPLPDGELDSFCVAPLQSKAKNTGLSIDGQKSGANAFHFDSVHWSLGKGNGGMDAQESTQEAMYEDLGAPVVTSVLAGFNACIFAYGQTGRWVDWSLEEGRECKSDVVESVGMRPDLCLIPPLVFPPPSHAVARPTP